MYNAINVKKKEKNLPIYPTFNKTIVYCILMDRGKKQKYLLVTVFLLVLILSSLGVKGEKDEVGFTIEIDTAYYMDFDSSGVENDVVVEFEVDLEINDDKYNLYIATITIDLEVELTLRSGLTYVYKLKMKVTDDEIEAMLVYFNHATENGWYTTSIKGTINALGITAFDTCVFDPPSGDNEDIPRISLYY